MNFINSLRQLISRPADQKKGHDDSDDDDTSSSSTRSSSETRTGSATTITPEKKKADEENEMRKTEEADEDDSEDEEEDHREIEAAPQDNGEENEASDDEDFSEDFGEEEQDPYGDLVSSFATLLNSIRRGIPTDMISTRSARDSSPRLEEECEERKDGVQSTYTADDDDFDVRTAETVASQTNLMKLDADDVKTAQLHDQTPDFESSKWRGEPNANRRPPCECVAKGRSTCTCSFFIDGNAQQDQTISRSNHPNKEKENRTRI